jgi:hypothetical protein
MLDLAMANLCFNSITGFFEADARDFTLICGKDMV